MEEYAARSNELRKYVAENKHLPRVRIVGNQACELGYSFAIGHVGTVVGSNDGKLRIFTSDGRIWLVPSEDTVEV